MRRIVTLEHRVCDCKRMLSCLYPTSNGRLIRRFRTCVCPTPISGSNSGAESTANRWRRLIREFPSWPGESSRGGLKESLLRLAIYTSSLTPMVPQELAFFPVPEQFRKHQGIRDRIASIREES